MKNSFFSFLSLSLFLFFFLVWVGAFRSFFCWYILNIPPFFLPKSKQNDNCWWNVKKQNSYDGGRFITILSFHIGRKFRRERTFETHPHTRDCIGFWRTTVCLFPTSSFPGTVFELVVCSLLPLDTFLFFLRLSPWHVHFFCCSLCSCVPPLVSSTALT